MVRTYDGEGIALSSNDNVSRVLTCRNTFLQVCGAMPAIFEKNESNRWDRETFAVPVLCNPCARGRTNLAGWLTDVELRGRETICQISLQRR